MKIKRNTYKEENMFFLLDNENNHIDRFDVENCESDGYVSDFIEFLDKNKAVTYVESNIESGLIPLGNIHVEVHLLTDDTFYWRGFGDLMEDDMRDEWMDSILQEFDGDESKLEEWKRNREEMLLNSYVGQI